MEPFRSYVILFNIAKKKNLGNLVRTANALGVSEVLVVGRRSFYELGAFGTSRHTTKRHFYALGDACDYLRGKQCRICGVEIVREANPVQSHPFAGDTAFMVGNEGTGLNANQMRQCDEFVYIPQYGSGSSLNVNVATAVVLHHFAVWSGRSENPRSGHGFIPCSEAPEQQSGRTG